MPRVVVGRMAEDELAIEVWRELGRPAGCAVVGGYVRDRLLARPTVDLDLSLAGSAEDVAGPARRLAQRHRRRAHLLGAAPHAVWRVELDHAKVELWPRGELTPAADLERRDFSCNALAWWLPEGPLEDRFGGLSDLERGRLRAVSRDNLVDDPLRLLRAARFTAEMPWLELEGSTRGWIAELAPRLGSAPRERVGQELLRLFSAPGARHGARLLLELGLVAPSAPEGTAPDAGRLEELLPAVDLLSGAARHPVSAARAAAGEAARLAPLVAAWQPHRESELAPLGWARQIRDPALAAATLLDDALAAVAGDASDRRRLIHRAGARFPAVLAFAAAVEPELSWHRWWLMWRRRGAEITAPRPLLTADQVMAATGLGPGPELGAVLRNLLEAQLGGELRTAGGAHRWLGRRKNRSPGREP